MRYISTRNRSESFAPSEAIAMGLARDGGLFLPEYIPALAEGDLERLLHMSYQQRAAFIMAPFLEGFTAEELKSFAESAYNQRSFDAPEIAPVKSLPGGANFLELWHGPTCAFKDLALQMLPYLLTASLKKNGEERTACILVATSGDTGKAALEGFCDVEHTRIMVFYPRDGVSDVQKLQMVTQAGSNVNVCAVRGNFDDAQNGVKAIFSDEKLREALSDKGYFFSSANSINWGRVLPQVVYYISAYCDMVSRGAIALGDKLNFCVPTGNFGDILAGWYAKMMGLPVKKLICASNRNNILTDFLETGVYDRNRHFYTTISPSMDILISSNLERLLFELSGRDDALVAGYMRQLSQTGRYQVSPAIFESLREQFAAGCCSDEETKWVIGETFRERGYLMDTHTAVAYKVLGDYAAATGDETPAVVVSTASPFKFCDAVLSALGDESGRSGLELIERLSEVSGLKAPASLAGLGSRTRRFTKDVDKADMPAAVLEFLK